MKTEIIAVGSELLAPHAVETNSLELTARLQDAGFPVSFRTVVGDDLADLTACARTALRRARLVVVCGGLGPTEDDRTREAFAAALGRGLVFRRELLDSIRERFRRRGRPMPAGNRKQAFLLEGAEALANPHGSACGQWLDTGRRILVLLPGPPHELGAMFENHVRPRLAGLASTAVLRTVLRATGLGESRLDSLLRPVYAALPPRITLITLARPGDLAVHIVWQGPRDAADGSNEIKAVERAVRRRLGAHVYSATGESLEQVVAGLLLARGLTLACAESCTGGLLGHRLTNVPGSSAWFLESVVAYANASKTRLLGVPAGLIERHGAVSAETAEAMARAARKGAGADFGLSITGIAGPTGGTPAKPVGLVYIGMAHAGGADVDRHAFFGPREMIKEQSVQAALERLRRRLAKMGRRG